MSAGIKTRLCYRHLCQQVVIRWSTVDGEISDKYLNIEDDEADLIDMDNFSLADVIAQTGDLSLFEKEF